MTAGRPLRVAERLLLASMRASNGRLLAPTTSLFHATLASALVAELAVTGRLALAPGEARLLAADEEDALLGPALQSFRDVGARESPASFARKLAARLAPLSHRVADALVRRGTLEFVPEPILGALYVRREYVLRERGARSAVVDQMDRTLAEPREASALDAATLLYADDLRILPAAIAGGEAKRRVANFRLLVAARQEPEWRAVALAYALTAPLAIGR